MLHFCLDNVIFLYKCKGLLPDFKVNLDKNVEELTGKQRITQERKLSVQQ